MMWAVYGYFVGVVDQYFLLHGLTSFLNKFVFWHIPNGHRYRLLLLLVTLLSVIWHMLLRIRVLMRICLITPYSS